MDGDLSNLTFVETSSNLEEDDQNQEETNGSCDGLGSFVPIVVQKISEKYTVKSFVHERQTSKTSDVVPWPSRGDTPINEFVTEGYISCAFPTLLATGDADFF